MSVQEEEQLFKEPFLGKGMNYFHVWSLGEEILSQNICIISNKLLIPTQSNTFF